MGRSALKALRRHLLVEAGDDRDLSRLLQEMRLLRVQQTGNVQVEVDSTESVDLTKVLEEMREQYEALVAKNRLELEKWFKSKVRNVPQENI